MPPVLCCCLGHRSRPRRAGRAGALAIAGVATVLFVALRAFERSGRRKRLHRYSEDHREALELRVSLILLFGLAALAVATHVSVMLAGFALGLVVGAVGEPRRLARQLFGITEGSSRHSSSSGWGPHCASANWGRPGFIVLGLALGLRCGGGPLDRAAPASTLSLGTLAAAQLGCRWPQPPSAPNSTCCSRARRPR